MGRSLLRKKRIKRQLLILVSARLDVMFIEPRLKRLKRATEEVRLLRLRTRHISTTVFNINVFTEEESLCYFRFSMKHTNTSAKLVKWDADKTQRNLYCCEPLSAPCIMMRKLAFLTHCVVMEFMLGMHGSAMCKVYRENVESMVCQCEYLFNPRFRLKPICAAMYFLSIHESGAPFNNFTGSIDCNKE